MQTTKNAKNIFEKSIHYFSLLRYNDSKNAGSFYSLCEPFLIFVLTIALQKHLEFANDPNYPIYLLIGLSTFGIFRTISLQSMNIFNLNAELFRSRKVHFKTLAFTIVARTYLLNFALVILILAVMQHAINIPGIIAKYFIASIPLLLLLTEIVIITSLLSVVSKTFKIIWSVIVRTLWFFIPLFVEAPNKILENLFDLNPLTHFINLIRQIVIENIFYSNETIIVLSYCLVFGICAYIIQKKLYRVTIERL